MMFFPSRRALPGSHAYQLRGVAFVGPGLPLILLFVVNDEPVSSHHCSPSSTREIGARSGQVMAIRLLRELHLTGIPPLFTMPDTTSDV
jgi:hypothetical protein